MENISKNALIIRPTNMIPKGYEAFIQWLLLGLSIVLIPGFIGLLTIWIPILNLFIIPRKYKKNMPISCVLDEEKLEVHNLRTGEVAWSVLWGDIDSIYYISTHWAMPKNIGLRLNNYETLSASMQKGKRPGTLAAKLTKWNTSKASMTLSRMVAKCEAIIQHGALDRSPKDFAALLYLYMQMSGVRSHNPDSSKRESQVIAQVSESSNSKS